MSSTPTLTGIQPLRKSHGPHAVRTPPMSSFEKNGSPRVQSIFAINIIFRIPYTANSVPLALIAVSNFLLRWVVHTYVLNRTTSHSPFLFPNQSNSLYHLLIYFPLYFVCIPLLDVFTESESRLSIMAQITEYR
jgi:hypothetical protein